MPYSYKLQFWGFQAKWHIYVANLANDGSTLALNPEGGILNLLTCALPLLLHSSTSSLQMCIPYYPAFNLSVPLNQIYFSRSTAFLRDLIMTLS